MQSIPARTGANFAAWPQFLAVAAQVVMRLVLFFLVVTLAAALVRADEAAADHSARGATGGEKKLAELRAKRLQISQQIAALSQQAAGTDGDHTDEGDDRLTLLRSIDAVEFHHLALLEKQNQLAADLADAERRLAELDEFAPSEPKPYSFLLLEGLKDQLADEEREEAALKSDQKSAEQLLAAAHTELDRAAQHRRASVADEREKQSPGSQIAASKPDESRHDAAAAGTTGGAAERQTELQLALALARERVALARTSVEVAKLRLAANAARQKQLKKKIEVVEKDVEFSSADRDAELARLARLDAELDRRRLAVEAGLHPLATAAHAAAKDATVNDTAAKDTATKKPERNDSNRAQAGSESRTSAAAESPGGRTAQMQLAGGLQSAGELYSAILLLVDQQREQIANERTLWRDRYRLAQGKASSDEVDDWLAAVGTTLSGLDDWTGAWQHRFNELSDEPRGDTNDATAERPAANAEGQSGEERRDQASSDQAADAAFREFSSAYAAARREVRHERQGLERFRDELKAEQAKHAGSQTTLGRWLASYWNLEVLSDEKEAVTLGKLVVLLAYIAAGMVLAYLASWLVGARILRRFGWHRGKAAALKSILFYTLFLFFGVVAFRALHVPLGAFAFLGGAAAIAVGFGSQDIMNNFMSGIILLTEQPIRVGDIIEFSAGQGQVTYIGLRSTRLLTNENHEMIVANKLLLDETVKNLTLSDRLVQMTVTIDVDRPLPVAPTKRKMQELVFAHPLVIKTCPPMVLLTEVDTYALRFQILFWVEHQSFKKCLAVQSEVLETITDAFPPLDAEVPASKPEAAEDDDATEAADDAAAAAEPSEPTEKNSAFRGSGPARNGTSEPPGRQAAGLSREMSNSIRKASRAAIQKEIRRAGLK
ncbi:MAG TPA: mechanosensitive ion channel domain-containing protein [Pirellulales bacterium]|nr:mechanosensitive ion channel domain-containing protein [Pirellulales bacterium]